MKTIYKYEIGFHPTWITMLEGAQILRVGHQAGTPYIWVQIDTKDSVEDRKFAIYGTGQEIPELAIHIGSYSSGPLEWHVYELGEWLCL